MFTIGEFSKVTGLTVKTLRFYHEEGLLEPYFVDPQTGYRHYDERQIEPARAIAFLRSLEFPVAKIKELRRDGGDDQRVLDAIERHKADIAGQIKHLRKVSRSLDQFIAHKPKFRTVRGELDQFFQVSRQVFFEPNAAQIADPQGWLKQFCRHCRDCERGLKPDAMKSA